jgi:hypothetical protein
MASSPTASAQSRFGGFRAPRLKSGPQGQPDHRQYSLPHQTTNQRPHDPREASGVDWPQTE